MKEFLKNRKPFIIFLFMILSILFLSTFILTVYGDNATPLNTNVDFQDVKDSSFVTWSVTLVILGGNYTCPFVCPTYDHINFTDVAATSSINPTQSFGTEITIGNTTITGIDQNNVYFTINPKNSTNPNLFYRFLSTNVPPQVTVNGTSVPQTSYLPSLVLYNGCTSNCVYQASSFLEIKGLGTSANNVIVCVALPCLTIEPAGTFDLGILLLGIVIIFFLLVVGVWRKKYWFLLFAAGIVALALAAALFTTQTIIEGSNQFLAPQFLYIAVALLGISCFVTGIYYALEK